MDQPPLPEIDPYVNRNLFSQNFLKELLPQDEAWRVDEDRLKLAMQAATNLYAGREEEWAGSNEPQLENRLVRPMLQALGHKFEVQPSLPTPETVRRPDYAFFGTDEGRLKAKRDHDGQAEYFNKAIAIGDAKRWDRSLDKKERSGRDSFDMLSPSWQIDYYLRMSGVKWGILTNGRLWRLYNKDTSFRLDIYYEIDLPRLLAAKDLETFKYFYLFFSREAFVADAEGLCFLDRVYQGSLEYAQAVGDDLKENVYKALRLLAEGFLHTRGNNLDPVEDLDEIHANSLVLLYRLLFINYAEDRGLLPRENALYKDSYGLVSMEGEIASKLQARQSIPSLQVTYWQKLRTLFDLINQGTAALGIDARTMGIPPYNGGLFDPEKHPFLEQHKVEDKWLAPVIDLLARSQGEGVGRGFVDYSSLDVRHLGSVYEGLLEYQLRVADEEMVAVKRGGKEQWAPAGEAGNSRVVERVQPGSIYLATDRGERKATGSYYTPDYIVKYIVEHTVGPLIEEKMKEDDPIEGILSLKVLDPAMGSGHFLVEATDRVAHALVEALGVTEKESEEEDIRWARREVVERCIYGVDLNPLAVELAKLSLWLHTVAEGKPLNFLDHHLKVGNSLIGAWVDDLGSLPVRRKRGVTKEAEPAVRQMNLFETRLDEQLPVMLNRMLEIISRRSDTLDDIRAKTAADQAVEQLKAPFKAVADLWVSTYFGNDVSEGEYQEALEHIGQPGRMLRLPSVERARDIAGDKRFFHWELEFPDVFYRDSRKRQNAGFDAVGGNPPWGATLDHDEKRFIFDQFAYARGKTDSYTYFMELGFEQLAPGGRVGEITPSTIFRGDNSQFLREALLNVGTWEVAIQLGEGVFGEVSFDSAVSIVRKASPPADSSMRCRVVSKGEDLRSVREAEVPLSFLRRLGFVVPSLDQESLELLERLNRDSEPLGGLATVRQGIITGDNKRFLANEQLSQKYRPFVKGAQIQRYRISNDLEWINYEREELLAPREAAIWEARQKIVTQGIRNIYLPDKLIAAYDDAKLCSSQNTNIVFNIAPQYRIHFVLSMLNSRLLNWYYRLLFTTTDIRCEFQRRLPIRRISFGTPERERTPLLREGEGLAESRMTRLGAQGPIESYMSFLESDLGRWVSGRLQAQPEQSDVVHDILAHLAERMTDMNRVKQTEAKGFLDWLAAYTGLRIDHWQLKSVLQTYWEHGRDDMVRALRENRKAIEKASGRNVEGREALEDIEREFEKSMAKLNPLLERIASTDRLIDLIVYRLYGLTEEEVAIVERAQANNPRVLCPEVRW